ncbi:sucrase ferredoxin [Umezawaea sp. Da 62-37]|uniref:sucrase ferredoxin n=1 Tax=Umezawaea sp. Da 62-37 TaxID=3075927 RepID=UPI0028F6FA4F|nr:sucrase ferredoxin [Umezawaea sp. Da 62-37]WNV85100.1 sucrase ferredoxin [Umezawaea sp. Da 62-37]
MARRTAEPMAGTSAHASRWLCVEQPGPWGADALWNSALDTDVAEQLRRRADAAGVRVVLLRRPGRSRSSSGTRNVYFASTMPGRSWLRHTTVSDPRELLDLDLSATVSGAGESTTDPLVLVCTNGRRDVCCAVTGRPLASALSTLHPGSVWESSHLGGHRFAPTVLLLPTGYCYGRVDVAACDHVLAEAEAGRMVTDNCRGRSTWTRQGQAAELALREHLGDRAEDAVAVVDQVRYGEGQWDVRLRHRGEVEWRVSVRQRSGPPARPHACGLPPEVPTVISVDSLMITSRARSARIA